ncbi:MAG: Phage tail sheath protein [bacterium ADurb.Bin212]|nr:MAG: Phage tail sheath protein [bacterium ADurb.Bin212]
MPISFNTIPSNLRVPFAYVEFDNTRAVQGSAQQVYKGLIAGLKLSGGTANLNQPYLVTSASQAKTLFGTGSMAAKMAEKWLANNSFTQLSVIAIAEPGAGVQAAATITVTGPATAQGSAEILIGDQKVSVAIASGDTANTIAASINAAINADSELPVTSSVSTNVVTMTVRHKGVHGNELTAQVNYYEGEALPTGVSLAITAFTAGTLAPDISDLITAMGEEQYNIIAFPFTDAASLTDLEAELLDRWGGIRQNDGFAFCAKNLSQSALITFGDGRNSQFVSMMGAYKVPTSTWEFAAGIAGLVAFHASIDQPRPLQTLQLTNVLPPKLTERLTLEERNLLLYDGISTFYVNPSGNVALERVITMYQENTFGAPDTSYLNIENMLNLSYLRFDWRTYILNKYPRHKLADDGTRFGPGQPVVTPNLIKAEAITKFRDWESQGRVENFDQFKEDLIVERNVLDRDRLDIYLPPDLINQLRVTATQIGFRL